MLRYLPVLLSLGLTIYCAVDAIQSEDAAVRNLPRMAWLALILLLPLGGPAAWLIAGRPRTAPRTVERPERRPRGPDDDPDFLRNL